METPIQSQKLCFHGSVDVQREPEKLDVFLARGCGETNSGFHGINRAGHNAKHLLHLIIDGLFLLRIKGKKGEGKEKGEEKGKDGGKQSGNGKEGEKGKGKGEDRPCSQSANPREKCFREGALCAGLPASSKEERQRGSKSKRKGERRTEGRTAACGN